MRFPAVVIAAALAVAGPALADAQTQAQTARKAERRGEWRKALEAWKAAYAADGNAEHLIGIGDAYAHLGNKEEARKMYESYLADPLALPANVEKVKGKIAELNVALALPAAPLPLPGLDLPRTAAARTAAAPNPVPLPLPGLALPPPSAKKDEETKVASAASPALELPLPGISQPKAQPAPASGKKEPEPAVASHAPAAKPIAMTTPAPRAPPAAVAEAPVPRGHAEVSGTQRTVAYVTAAVALAALGGGAFALTQANSAHGDLTRQIHDGATAQQLLETERRNKTLSFIGLSGGLVAAGIATALFAF